MFDMSDTLNSSSREGAPQKNEVETRKNQLRDDQFENVKPYQLSKDRLEEIKQKVAKEKVKYFDYSQFDQKDTGLETLKGMLDQFTPETRSLVEKALSNIAKMEREEAEFLNLVEDYNRDRKTYGQASEDEIASFESERDKYFNKLRDYAAFADKVSLKMTEELKSASK